jgi:hypothetical protein
VPRLALFVLPLLGLAAAPAQAADRKFDPDAAAKAVAPFLDDNVMLVAHVDLTRLDAAAVVDWFAKMAKIKPKEIDRPKKMLTTLAQGVARAGVKDVYLVGSMQSGWPTGILVMPLEPGADDKVIAKVFGEVIPKEDGFAVEVIHKAAVVGTGDDHKRLKALKPTPYPELARAFAAAGDGTAHFAVIASEKMRTQIEKDAPPLPKELHGDGSVKVITRGVQWAAAGVEWQPTFKATVFFQAKDKDAAKELHALAEKLPKFLAKEEPFRDLPDAEKALRNFVPKPDGDRLTLTVDEKMLTTVVGPKGENADGDISRLASANNMHQIGQAMYAHNDANGTLPAVANFDKQGKPLMSWRVHILPYIEQAELYKQFKLDEPWDSDNNKKLIAKMPKVFANPDSPKLAADGKTTYLLPVHKEAVFTGDKTGISIARIKDGASNSLMLVDAADDAAVIWTKPDDLKLDPKAPAKGLAARHKDSYLVLFADGQVKLLPKKIDNDALWLLFMSASGKPKNVP